ncbi:hypothetical protein [Streptomyces sp. CA-179760]|uniref:hypothetical protein n=1 Tax=Streptomyces sp. CA-179760 TaxID=3240054 RepID=UPI003D907350
MARRTLEATAATLTAAAALLLTACGSGAEPPEEPKGARETGTRSASPTGTKRTHAERPDVSLPKDLDLVFDFDRPSDQDSATALDDAANYIRALNHGITKQDPEDPAFQFYSSGQAAQYAHSQIKEYADGGWTLTGQDRYYQAEAKPFDESQKVKTISVTFCEDQSKVYGKEVKSEKIHRTRESLASYQRFTVLLAFVKGKPGWRAQQVTVEEEAEECRS